MYDWYDHPIDSRASHGGELGVNGRLYKGGEFLPFYIPRPEMPQVDEKDYPALFEFVKSQSIPLLTERFQPNQLRAHQRVSWDKVVSMDEVTFRKPVLVSQDRFVLDGNHRWTAHVHRNVPLSAYVLGLEFEAAIGLLFKFPKTYSYGDGKQHAVGC